MFNLVPSETAESRERIHESVLQYHIAILTELTIIVKICSELTIIVNSGHCVPGLVLRNTVDKREKATLD